MSRRTIFHLLFLALFLFLAYWVSTYFAAYTDDAYLETDILRIAPRVKGHVKEVAVRDNQHVVKGELLACIDPVPFQLRVTNCQAKLDQAKARLEMQKNSLQSIKSFFKESSAALKLATATEERFRRLLRKKTIAQQTYDVKMETYQAALDHNKGAQAEVDEATSAIQAYLLNVKATQAELDIAEFEANHTKLFSPVEGFVTALNIKPGDYAKVGQSIMAVVSDEDWRIVANYREQLVRHIQPGQRVVVHLDNYPWQLFEGKVQGVAHGVSRSPVSKKLLPYVEPKTNWIRLSRRFPVRINLKQSKGVRLLSGSDARTIVVY
ncbi:MAG: hypothetical protein BA863_09970 [Desulfovibrio sp. S3730MH75]|nr:MAG: hypothetical protein BA863_09970 [Desulfovibrio sp. S3730MH75]